MKDKIVITEHGYRYYTRGRQLCCPECNTNEISYKILVKDVNIECHCQRCKCDFIVYKNIEDKKKDKVKKEIRGE